MPVAPRIDKRATRIAFKILGTPAPLRKDRRSKKQDEINNRLLFEETSRVR